MAGFGKLERHGEAAADRLKAGSSGNRDRRKKRKKYKKR
jgi:hypothetical protein